MTLEGVQAPAETPGLASVVETVDMTAHTYQKTRIAHWDQVARKLTEGRFGIGGFYQKQLAHYYSLLVAPGMKVLEVGCGTGDLLAALNPAIGVGVDFSNEMIDQAREKYPQLRFIQADAHEVLLESNFDFIILSDLVNDLWDVQAVFKQLSAHTHVGTRLIF